MTVTPGPSTLIFVSCTVIGDSAKYNELENKVLVLFPASVQHLIQDYTSWLNTIWKHLISWNKKLNVLTIYPNYFIIFHLRDCILLSLAEVYIVQLFGSGGGVEKNLYLWSIFGKKTCTCSHFHSKVGKFYILGEIIAQKCNKK